MTRSFAAGAVLLACAALGGCAMFGKQPASAPSGTPSQVPVYNTTQLVASQYTVVQRLWIDEWRSNVTYPTFRSVEDGIEAMREKAAGAGGDGLLNVMCMDATGYSRGRLLCYGDAIKFN